MIASPRLDRRTMMAAGAAAVLGTMPVLAAAASAPRIAVLDWGWASTLLSIGVAPVGVAERRLYAAWVGEPALPPETAELGLRGSPSLELLAALKPDLILTNALNTTLRPQLDRIAPSLPSPIFAADRTPLANSRTAVRLLAERIGRVVEGEAWLAESDRRIAAAHLRLAGNRGRPLVPVQFLDGRHLTYYGQGSLYGDVLVALGLNSAYPGPTSPWGHHGGDIASVADLPPADLLLVAPVPAASVAALQGPSLLASLVKAGHRTLYRLPAAWTYGDLTAATRFAELVADALTDPSGKGATSSGAPA